MLMASDEKMSVLVIAPLVLSGSDVIPGIRDVATMAADRSVPTFARCRWYMILSWGMTTTSEQNDIQRIAV